MDAAGRLRHGHTAARLCKQKFRQCTRVRSYGWLVAVVVGRMFAWSLSSLWLHRFTPL